MPTDSPSSPGASTNTTADFSGLVDIGVGRSLFLECRAAGSEVPAYEASISELDGTPGMPAIPAVVMSSDHPWDLQVTPGASTWPGWVAAQALLAESLDATHITETDSGHGLPVEQPALVTDAVLGVLESVRAP